MFTRRIILLFVLFVAGFLALAIRLATFQVAQADDWSRLATRFIERHYLIDTHRGTILDSKGRPLAQDEPSDDIAIDFRAIAMDDRWITQRARERLKAMNIASRDVRIRQLPLLKDQIADQIAAIPDVIVAQYNQARQEKDGETIGPLTAEDIRAKYNTILQRIHILKQDQWLRRYVKDEGDADTEVDTPDDTPITPVAEEMQTHTIVENVPFAVKVAINRILDELPGVVVTPSKRRKYFYGDVAAQVIGTTQAVTEAQWKKDPFERPDLLTAETGNLHGYLPGDRMGATGIEAYCESLLRGTRGVGLRELGGEDIPDKHVDSSAGRNVQLTLDIELQKAIQARLYENNHELLKGQHEDDEAIDSQRDHNVAIVVLRIKDRAVLTMLSTPTFDLNDYQKNAGALNTDEATRPMLNRAMRNTYPPGSTVKPLVAAAALTEGSLLSPDVIVNCRGYLDTPGLLRCSSLSGHGPLNMRQALERSCNVYFYTQGRNLGLEKLSDWYSRFGFGTITGIGPAEAAGNVPDPATFHNAELMRSEATQLGIGQGALNVTPLQMANAYATLLEAGRMQAPTLVAGESRESRQVFTISPEHLRAIADGMELVVHGDSGTARSGMRGMALPIAGKTGSATTELRAIYDEKGNKVYKTERDADDKSVLGTDGKPLLVYQKDRDGKLLLDRNGQPMPIQERRSGTDSWFVGYAPMTDPQFVVVAVKEFGGHGGITAVPVVRAAFVELEKQGYLPNVDAK